MSLILFIGEGIYFYITKNNKVSLTTHDPCLSDNEIVEYTINEKYSKELKIPTVPTTIYIKNRSSGINIYSFSIDNFLPMIRVQKCGVYVVKKFSENDYTYNDELWRYDYNGIGTKIFTLASFKDKKLNGISYGTAFTIDPQEKYISLERSYLGQPDYALVIKDAKTLIDIFVLTLEDIKKNNPNVEAGIVGLGDWTPDSEYLWGTLFDGALDTAYIWVKTGNWKVEVFSPPPDLPSGAERIINFSGYIAYADFPTFFGIDIIAKQEQEKFIKEDRIKHLYLYNLRTKEKKLLATTTAPEKRFNIKWLSDTELQYERPDGEKRVYKIEK